MTKGIGDTHHSHAKEAYKMMFEDITQIADK